MQEEEKVVVADDNFSNILFLIKRLLFNYDMTIAYVKGEIDLRSSKIDIITKTDEKLTANNKKKIIILKADIDVFNNFLADLLEKRKMLTDGLEIILTRFDKPEITKIIFFEYLLNGKPKEEMLNFLNITEEEFNNYCELIKSMLINSFKYQNVK